MTISIFLGQVIGIYLFVTSLGLLINKKIYKKFLEEVVNSIPFLLFSGFLSFIIGLLIVISHNLWIANWQIFITIFGWMILIKGIWLLLFPKSIPNFMKKRHPKKFNLMNWVKWFSWICLFIGAYLIYLTFFRLPIDFIISF